MGRKSIPILLKATSPEGETKTFTSIGEAAKELGFSESGVGKAFHEKRNRIGEYELEWLEPESDVDPEAAVRIERLKKTFTRTVCVYCNKPLTREDRVADGFDISKLNEKTGYPMEKVGSFTWNSFLFPGHFSVQAFFLTEIGPVPWNRVNKLFSCSLLFHPSHFLCKREINY